MSKVIFAAALAVGMGMSVPTYAATNLELPADVNQLLISASAPEDVALILEVADPRFAATIFAEANALGIASPPQILSESIDQTTSLDIVRDLVCAAAEAVPGLADVSAGAAYTAAGRDDQAVADAIATCAVDGIEAAGYTEEQVAAEAVEIAAALRDRVPEGQRQAVADAIAAATNSTNDTGLSIATAADLISEIEVADITPTGSLPPQNFLGTPSFVDLPSAAQNNPAGTDDTAPPNAPGPGNSPL